MPPARARLLDVRHALLLGTLVVLWQACGGEDLAAPRTGDIVVTTTTTGDQPDPDGYRVALDGAAGVPIGTNATVTLTAAEGDHEVTLDGLAVNCTVGDQVRQTVRVTAGQPASVVFEITCSSTTGGLRVVTSTSGYQADTDGYGVVLDGGDPQRVDPNDTLTLTAVEAGNHSVGLTGLISDCTVDGDNPRSIEVTAGSTADVEFRVVCPSGVQHWTAMQSGTDADLPEVWGSGPSDVFVVGELVPSDLTGLQGVILHYDGSRWTSQLTSPGLRLRGVWGSSPTDVFAVGFDFESPEARVAHYDGRSWSGTSIPSPGRGEEFDLQSVWGSSRSDVYAVGSVFNGAFDESLILHYDGTNWRRTPVPGLVRPELIDVWGTGTRDVYAVGRDDVVSSGVILHYDGNAWSPVLNQPSQVLRSVWGSSTTDVFAAGFKVVGQGENAEVIGIVWHYDGTSWAEMALPPSGVLYELWGTSATDVFAVGQDGLVLHFDGSSWAGTNPTTSTLLGIWAGSPIDVFAVGNGGTILHGTP